eukprot:781528-Pyramimonas_sp.AAC.1
MRTSGQICATRCKSVALPTNRPRGCRTCLRGHLLAARRAWPNGPCASSEWKSVGLTGQESALSLQQQQTVKESRRKGEEAGRGAD